MNINININTYVHTRHESAVHRAVIAWVSGFPRKEHRGRRRAMLFLIRRSAAVQGGTGVRGMAVVAMMIFWLLFFCLSPLLFLRSTLPAS